MPKTGDSAEQRRAERLILAAASERFGKTLKPRKVATPEGGHVEIDGVSEDDSVLVEVYAHQGALRGSQPDKVMSDALKLLWASRQFAQRPRIAICLACHEAARTLRWNEASTRRRPWPWKAEALRDLGVEVEVFDLTPTDVERLRDVQVEQER